MRRAVALVWLLLSCAFVNAQVSIPLTPESIGRRIYERSAGEISAAVVPTYYRYPVGNVLRNGAVCNGVADDSDEIQAALNSSYHVWIPDGYTCLIQNSITPRSGTTFELLGNATLIAGTKNWSTGMVNIVGTNDITIRGGIYDGRKSLSGAGQGILAGVLIRDGNRIRVESATFQNMPSDGTTNGALGDGVYIGRVPAGPGSNDVVISNNRFLANVRQGISVVAGIGVRIIGNSFIGTSGNNPGGGIDIEANTTGDPLRGVAITGNYFENNFYGVVVQQYCYNVAITGNTFRTSRRTDVYLVGGTNVTVAGNSIEAGSSDGTGIPIDVYAINTGVVSGNTIVGVGASSSTEGAGIVVRQGNTNFSVIGNVITTPRLQGIVVGTSTMVQPNNNILVSGNTIIDAVYPAAAANTSVIGLGGNNTSSIYSTNVTVTNNQIIDTRSGGNEADIAISVQTSIPAATQATYKINNNRISGPASEFGLGNARPGCVRVTYDAPTLSQNEAVVNGGQTLTGAVVGDLVDVYPVIALGGIQATGYVTAADTAALMLENPNSTGASINLANANYWLCLRKVTAL